MTQKIAAEFQVDFVQVLDERGKADKKLLPKLSTKQLRQMYKTMVLAKKFDERALKLQRQGRIGTYASHRGQEACQIGSIAALEKQDWVFPAFRENAAFIAMGYPMYLLYAYWGGNEQGNKIPKGFNAFPVSIPVGSQPLHAVGASWASKLRGKKEAAIVFFGDGATSEGDFHEAMNFAGVFRTPTIFLCQNNQYAISVPREKQTASATLAQKALAYGFSGVQVDGNDVFAVYRETKKAIEKARKGKGPTMIECITYRLQDHTTADDATRYRTKKEVEEWKKKDPIERLRKYLENEKIWNKKMQAALEKESDKNVNDAVKKFESMPAPNPFEMFDYLFAELPQRLGEQRKYLQQIIEKEKSDSSE